MSGPTIITQDMASVNPNAYPTTDKIFIKIANDTIFTPQLNLMHLDQSVVLSTLISNASVQTRQILSRIDISETFTSNLKAVNTAKVEELNNALKHVHGIDEDAQVPYYLKDLKKQGLSLALLRRVSALSRSQGKRCKILRIPSPHPQYLCS